jgi:LuxR family quorum sensing-dependent transcriptional regulator
MRFQRGLHLVERCVTESDVPALVAEFIAITKDFGFDSVAGGGWIGLSTDRMPRFYFNTWPAAWLAIYLEHQATLEDPAVNEALRRATPFLLSELPKPNGDGDAAMDMAVLGWRYGWVDGLVVPAHGPAGYQGLVSMATFNPLMLTATERSLLWIMSLSIHERCRTTPGFGSDTPPPRLTPRELQCMRWAAAGKTDWDIGQLLGIAEATAHFHIGRVMRRLGTSSRTNAVALLVLYGIL